MPGAPERLAASVLVLRSLAGACGTSKGAAMADERDAAFVALYRENHARIVNAATWRLADRSRAEDVASEVFRVAWQHHRRGHELTLPWLYGVMKNVVRRERRLLERARRLAAKVARLDPPPPSALAEGGTDSALHEALARLRRTDRELLYMAYWEELPGPQLAALLGITVDALHARLSRARRQLRRLLDDAAPEEVTPNG
jgi:RNA polymerase sigma-70 factor (ECF subfamily)